MSEACCGEKSSRTRVCVTTASRPSQGLGRTRRLNCQGGTVMDLRTLLSKASHAQATGRNRSHSAAAGRARRNFLRTVATALFALVGFAAGPAATAHDDRGDRQHWVASWATSPAAYFVYVAPVPQNQ